MNDPSNKSGWFSWLKQPKASQDSSSSNPEDEEQLEASKDEKDRKQKLLDVRRLYGFHNLTNVINLAPPNPQPSQDSSTINPAIVEPSKETVSFSMPENPSIIKPPSDQQAPEDSESSIVESSGETIPEQNPDTNSSSVVETPSIIKPPSETQAPEDSESSITAAEPPKEDSLIFEPLLQIIPEHNPETASSSGPEKPLIQESEKPSPFKIPVNSFFLKLKTVRNLKIAITALVDPEFNQEGTAMIQVDSSEFSLTVRTGLDGNVLGHFGCKSLGFIKYDFQKPLLRKKINLNDISEHLDLVPDEDSVSIYHVHGSHRLSFVLPGGKPVPYFDVKLHEISPEFKEFPKITYACLLAVPTEKIWILIDRLRNSEEKMVSYGISHIKATLFVGPRGTEFTYKMRDIGIVGMEPEQVHHVWFRWPYCEALQKASILTPTGVLGLVRDPEESIAWHFHLDNVDLVYVKKASKFIANFRPKADKVDEATSKWHPLSSFAPCRKEESEEQQALPN